MSKSKSKQVGMSPTAYAKHRGLHLSTIKQYIDEGTLDGAWKYGSNKRKIIFQKLADKLLDEPDDNEDDAPVDIPKGGQNSTKLTSARTAKTAIEAQISKLKYEKIKGSLVERSEVEKVASEMASLTKESILTLPDRLSPVLAGETDPNTIYKILTEELTQALRNLSKENYNFFKVEIESE